MKIEDTDAVVAALVLQADSDRPFTGAEATAVKAISALGAIGIERKDAGIRDLARKLIIELIDGRRSDGDKIAGQIR